MKVMEDNGNIIILVKKELLHSDIPEFIDLRNQIANCIYKSIGKEKTAIVDLLKEYMKGR